MYVCTYCAARGNISRVIGRRYRHSRPRHNARGRATAQFAPSRALSREDLPSTRPRELKCASRRPRKSGGIYGSKIRRCAYTLIRSLSPVARKLRAGNAERRWRREHYSYLRASSYFYIRTFLFWYANDLYCTLTSGVIELGERGSQMERGTA